MQLRGRLGARSVAALLVCAGLALAGCASSGGEGAASAQAAPRAAAPPAGSPLARVTAGMNETEVRKLLGEPSRSNSYMTGKAWIPFYYGPDTARTDWVYDGQGRVVFSRNRYTGELKVIRTLYDPSVGR
jgi:hypothetical protein